MFVLICTRLLDFFQLLNEYITFQNDQADHIELVAEEDMAGAISELKNIKLQLGECNSEKNVDVTVSFDDTWNHVERSAVERSVDTGNIITSINTNFAKCTFLSTVKRTVQNMIIGRQTSFLHVQQLMMDHQGLWNQLVSLTFTNDQLKSAS
jgi:hypothetical protein